MKIVVGHRIRGKRKRHWPVTQPLQDNYTESAILYCFVFENKRTLIISFYFYPFGFGWAEFCVLLIAVDAYTATKIFNKNLLFRSDYCSAGAVHVVAFQLRITWTYDIFELCHLFQCPPLKYRSNFCHFDSSFNIVKWPFKWFVWQQRETFQMTQDLESQQPHLLPLVPRSK